MPLEWIRIEHFRCLSEVELTLDSGTNLFIGPNASGKTSLLEAAFFLGRGRSFRSRRRDQLIRHGQRQFQVTGRTSGDSGAVSLGVRGGRDETEIRVGGAAAGGIADLAERFPVQIIDPEIHKLLEEGPWRRRRFLDWGVFHVEQGFLENWQRYHHGLRQRNAALRQAQPPAAITAWDHEVAEAGERLAAQRDEYIRRLAEPLRKLGRDLLGIEVTLVHSRGWTRGRSLREEFLSGIEDDRRYRATQAGPHRADVTVRLGERLVKGMASRGQQKLVAAGLLLAQMTVQQQDGPWGGALLLDDPAAELDSGNLDRLMAVIRRLPVQLWVTSLREERIPGLPGPGRVFHVEHGRVVEG